MPISLSPSILSMIDPAYAAAQNAAKDATIKDIPWAWAIRQAIVNRRPMTQTQVGIALGEGTTNNISAFALNDGPYIRTADDFYYVWSQVGVNAAPVEDVLGNPFAAGNSEDILKYGAIVLGGALAAAGLSDGDSKEEPAKMSVVSSPSAPQELINPVAGNPLLTESGPTLAEGSEPTSFDYKPWLIGGLIVLAVVGAIAYAKKG